MPTVHDLDKKTKLSCIVATDTNVAGTIFVLLMRHLNEKKQQLSESGMGCVHATISIPKKKKKFLKKTPKNI